VLAAITSGYWEYPHKTLISVQRAARHGS